jgi:hypothetical protein
MRFVSKERGGTVGPYGKTRSLPRFLVLCRSWARIALGFILVSRFSLPPAAPVSGVRSPLSLTGLPRAFPSYSRSHFIVSPEIK